MFNASRRKRPFPAAASSARGASAAANDADDADGPSGSKPSLLKKGKVATPPTSLEIDGVEVHFPFRPYDVQRDYMASVLTALREGQHALLESPTGTGKTLCLLCSALAWQRREKGRMARAAREGGGGGGGPSQLSQQPPAAPEGAAPRPNGGDEEDAPPPPRNKPPVIIYASRTHSQLSQVVGELRNTRYRPRHAVLGSREHTCIHPKVNPVVAKGNAHSADGDQKKSSTEVNNGCSKLQKGRKCMYRNNLEERSGKDAPWRPPTDERRGAGAEYEQPVLDMEDLVTVGRRHKVCPFYHTRSLLRDAELIFVPYNYMFDRDARETTLAEVDFANAVLIFDEAHNLEEFASESASFDLSSADLAGCTHEVQRALQLLEVNPEMGEGSSLKDNMLRLKSILLRFEKYLDDDVGEASHPGEFIFDVFREGAGINHDNRKLFVDFVKRVQDVIMEHHGNANSSGTPRLDHFLSCVKRAFGSGTNLLAIARAKSYRVHVTKMGGKSSGGGFKGGRTISYWCFAPALAMRELSFLKVRSILITSGTLAPLPSFSMELGLDFPVRLENDHVIRNDQIFVRVVGKGVSGKELSSKFGRRDDPEYISELGNTLASLCRNIPGGVLVFFPSYSAMQAAIERWGGPSSERFGVGRPSFGRGGRGAAFFAARKRKQASAKYVFPMVPQSFQPAATMEVSTPWKRLLARKSIVLEPRSTSDLSDAIAEYKKFLSMPKSAGAILLGVCRGKISEGIDFSDDMCRAVIVTGLPFAPYLDPKVKLKREFLDAARASARARPSVDGGFGNGKFQTEEKAPLTANTTLSGAEWYNQQAHRAVNQAIGRVIRHRHDYGAVLLLDHRFAQASNRDGLSKWLRPHLRDETFGASTRGLVKFYKESKAKAAEKAKQENPQMKILKYENDEEKDENFTKVLVVATAEEKERGLAADEAFSNGYVQPDRVIKVYDINEKSAAVDYDMANNINSTTLSDSKKVAGTGLGALYSKEKVKSDVAPSPPSMEKKPSSFGNTERKTRASDSSKFSFVKRDPVKVRPRPGRKSDAAKLQAKMFFGKASSALVPQDLMKVQKLLVAMKGHGDSKNESSYIKAAKELISILVDSQVDATRIQLISSLFPLLPVKYRYKIEKLASILAFEKSSLRSRCKDSLLEHDFSTIKTFVLPMIFSESSPHNSSAFSDREFLEDSQKVLSILLSHGINLQIFLDLMPQQAVRRVRTLALEMKKSREVARAKERSSNFKGESCVNSALFRRSEKNPFDIRATQNNSEVPPDSEAEKNMMEALSQAKDVNRRRKDRVIDFQNKVEAKMKKPLNPYCRPALQESTKRNVMSNGRGDAALNNCVRKGESATSRPVSQRRANDRQSLDMVDRCLQQVKSDGFVRSKTPLEQINGRINAHVPKGMICVVCSETPKEPLVAECNHSACLECWKTWLKRQNSCPTCRAPTTMKDLSKLVFARAKGKSGAPSLTQICASEDEGESDNEDELEIVAN